MFQLVTRSIADPLSLISIIPGLSAALLLLLSGEILGSSGIASSIVLEPKKHLADPKVAWKLVFMSTFLLFSNVVLAKYFTDDERLGSDPSIPVVSSWGYLLGGLFVGFGTRLSNGCTTGHGIVSCLTVEGIPVRSYHSNVCELIHLFRTVWYG